MGVGSVAGIDDGGLRLSRDHRRQARATVADDDVVGAHGLERLDGFPDGLAFGDGGLSDVEVRDIRGEAFGGDLEGRVGAGARLVEQHEHGPALERGDLFNGAGEELLERDGLLEEMVDLLPFEGRDVE